MSRAAVSAELVREIGRWDKGIQGPTLLVTAGVHGNEPAGLEAIGRVLQTLHGCDAPLRGRVVALRGNLGALAVGSRYLSRDLNRGWSASALAAIRAKPAADRSSEDREQLELIELFLEVERTASGPVLFIDLHTSSADGSPFLCLADTIDNRRLGALTGVPVILGIEENLAGASLEWFADRGISGFAVEGGQHTSAAAVDNLEAVVWQLLVQLRMLSAAVVDIERHRARIRAAVGAAPSIVEITYRHAISSEDAFRMQPDLANFDTVAAGQLLATDRSGELRAPSACYVMLPLYQALGDDGFFLARRVGWLRRWSAKWSRALSLDRLLVLLPGVRRDPDDVDTLLVTPGAASRRVIAALHLLGFRKERERSGHRAFSRRRSRVENRRL